MPNEAAENLTEPNFVGYMLDRDVFLVGTLDAENLASGVSPLNTLQLISSEWTPEEKYGSDLTASLDDTTLSEYVNAVAEALRQFVKDHGEIEIAPMVFEALYEKYLERQLATAYPQQMAGCYLARSSIDWSEIEAEGQFERFREVALKMLRDGFVPKFGIADGMTGTQMIRPGTLRLIARALAGQVDGLFLHTLDRFSRAELDGLLSFVLVHRLIGNITYKSTVPEVFVRFDPSSRESMLHAGQEIMKGALDGARIRSLMERGKVGRLRRLKSVSRSFGRRLFHVGRPQ